MIPISDNFPSRRLPIITRTLVVLNVLIFLFELSLSPEALNAFIRLFGLIPAYYTTSEGIQKFGLLWLGVPLFSSIFLHGGLLHLFGNMITLWIFGDNVEDRMGRGWFIVFYFGMGIAASLGQIISAPGSEVPVIGASGAIAGVMGAYFLLFPRSTVVLAVPIFIFIDFWEVPAPVFFVFWFALQFFSGVAGGESGVAWWAHIAGFIGGMIIAKLFFSKKPKKNSGFDWFDWD